MLKYAPNITMMWRDIPLPERLARVSRGGLGAFEFQFVGTFGLAELVAGKEEHGLKVALFNLDVGDPTLKSSLGYLGRPEAESEFFRSLEEALDAAALLGCTRLNALAGRATPGMSWEAQRDLMVKRLQKAADEAAGAGVTVLLEAISHGLPGYLVNYSRQALEIIDLVNRPNCKFQYDVYHMQLMEGNLITTLQANIAKIGHVQIADVPGRHEPGTGEINYHNVLKALDETVYSGYVGLELIPLNPENPFAWITS